jgi:hypothetical protein
VHLPYVLGLILAFVPRFRLYPRGKFLMVFIVPILGLLPDIEALLDENPRMFRITSDLDLGIVAEVHLSFCC